MNIFFLEEGQVGRRQGYSLQIFKELPSGVGIGEQSRQCVLEGGTALGTRAVHRQTPKVHLVLLSQPHTQRGEFSCSGARSPGQASTRTSQRPEDGVRGARAFWLGEQQSRAELCAHLLLLSRQIYAAVAKGLQETIYC